MDKNPEKLIQNRKKSDSARYILAKENDTFLEKPVKKWSKTLKNPK
jgi:hypothetical protein